MTVPGILNGDEENNEAGRRAQKNAGLWMNARGLQVVAIMTPLYLKHLEYLKRLL
jgi:hypothetical protein